MPIKIPDNLPAKKILTKEHIFVLDEQMALRQDIRPLRILILNLMPTKIVTETQLLRMLSNTPLQTEVSFIHPASHTSKNTPPEHLATFYSTLDEIRDEKYDGMIITGAPVELLPFEDVNYWEELCAIMDWTTSNVTTTLHICWAAQAGMYYHFGIPKYPLEKKLSGVFEHEPHKKSSRLLRGFDDTFYVPHSRYTETRISDVEKVSEIDILVTSKEAGLCICASKDRRQIFMTGHLEYDRDTLKLEYERDLAKGLNPDIPKNYFPNDDPTQRPYHQWKSHAYLMYANWLNYYVYQATPYDLSNITKAFVPERKGEPE
ncbi:MAG: homoserine O-succinyltransferase [Clostridiaceae bacterium]|jgi:homoserine O-succinyltransferase|nr:homoserine O-succinyltransferase [Clostridiaceae bacterium]